MANPTYAFVAHQRTAISGASGSVSFDLPAISNGNLLLALFKRLTSADAPPDPDVDFGNGWKCVRGAYQTSVGVGVCMAWKYGSSEGATSSVSHAWFSGDFEVSVVAYDGITATNPIADSYISLDYGEYTLIGLLPKPRDVVWVGAISFSDAIDATSPYASIADSPIVVAIDNDLAHQWRIASAIEWSKGGVRDTGLTGGIAWGTPGGHTGTSLGLAVALYFDDDTTPPEVLIDIEDGLTIGSEDINGLFSITATATDASGVRRTVLSVGNTYNVQNADSATVSMYLQYIPDGLYRVYAYAIDDRGNQSPAVTKSLILNSGFLMPDVRNLDEAVAGNALRSALTASGRDPGDFYLYAYYSADDTGYNDADALGESGYADTIGPDGSISWQSSTPGSPNISTGFYFDVWGVLGNSVADTWPELDTTVDLYGTAPAYRLYHSLIAPGRIQWDKVDARRYEAGVDRGVLYLQDGLVVPWNGLISVAEEMVGGEHSEFYLDGLKYLDVVGNRDFSATVTAFSAPEEFGPYGGKKSLIPGFSFDKQPKKRFNFSYRTGLEEGHYKLHLLYNVLASPTSLGYSTLSETISPSSLAWKFDATPVPVSARRPTAHFAVDSRRVSSDLLATLENLLYGTDSTAPSFPSITELLAMFS